MSPNMKETTPLWKKTVVYAGKGNVPEYNASSKVIFHYKTTTASEPDVVIDDSRTMKKPMELILGKKFKLEVWEEFVKTMRVHEVAQFHTPKELLLSYPMVSKSLRNLNDKIEAPTHCCGMMSQSLGYADLDKLVESPVDLIFIFELLKVENSGEYEKESWAMSEEEKMQSIPRLKEEGNTFYKTGDYDNAEKRYSEALGILENMMIREKPGDEEWIKFETLKIPLLLNYSQCKLLKEDYYSVIEHTNSILSRHPDNIKALFRRGKAYVGAWEPEKARSDFMEVMRLDKALTVAVKKELRNLENLEKEKNAEDKLKLEGRMFCE
ncbi:AH receptor-interacting protein [Nymphon striatum]|nr:AH receptor-interacting protein [Nymphon striatum]